MIRRGSRRVFTTEIRIVQVMTQLTDGRSSLASQPGGGGKEEKIFPSFPPPSSLTRMRTRRNTAGCETTDGGENFIFRS